MTHTIQIILASLGAAFAWHHNVVMVVATIFLMATIAVTQMITEDAR